MTRANGNTLWAAVLYLVLALGKAEISLLGWTETAAVTYHNIWEGYCLPFFSFGSSTVAEAERAAAWQSHGCQAMSKRWMHSSAQLASSKLYSSGNDLVSHCHRSSTASDTQDHSSRTLSEASLYLTTVPQALPPAQLVNHTNHCKWVHFPEDTLKSEDIICSGWEMVTRTASQWERLFASKSLASQHRDCISWMYTHTTEGESSW